MERSEERSGYEAFESGLLALLRGWRHVLADGTAVGFAQYLASQPEGDERVIVDPLASRILGTLGYESAHIVPQESVVSSTGRQSFPDFQVRLANVPGNTVFVVEDKATNIDDFTSARVARENESPLAQLRRYVLVSGSRSRLGLLCNGRRLEGWEMGPVEPHLLFRVDLAGLVGSEPPTELQQGALQTLWRRCGRHAFESIDGLIQQSIEAVRLSKEDALEMGRMLGDGCSSADLDAFRARRMQELWRGRALPARSHAGRIVASLEKLIGLFEADVRGQLEAALTTAAEVQRHLDQLSSTPPEDQVQALRTHRDRFSLDEAAFEQSVVLPLIAYWESPRPRESAILIEDLRDRLRPKLRRQLADGIAVSAPRQRTMLVGGEGEEAPETVASAREEWMASLLEAVRRLVAQADGNEARRQEIESTAASSLRAARGYETWRARVTASALTGLSEASLRTEYARQTAYVYVIRLLLVRICEDKGVLARKLSDGGLAQWEEDSRRYLDYASGRSYDYLTDMAFECASNLYAHFFAAATLFDWYRLDEKLLLRAIVELDAYDFEEIAEDIIGTAYSNYLRAGKHAQGRYYTRPQVVETMLDEVGFRGSAVIDWRLADVSCGSGTFLVAAAREIIRAHQGPDGTVPPERAGRVVQAVVDGVFGIDVNPFACYLAETNLLIQVLGLLNAAGRAGTPQRIERFNVYCADALVVDPHTRIDIAAVPADERPAELMKARLDPFAGGFDFLVGNPPYVRADDDDPSVGKFREAVVRSGQYECLEKRWDLYVPFVELNARLLKSTGRCCLITIESIGEAPYAARLREKLCTDWTLDRLVFAEKLKLFPDSPWQSNLIFTYRGTPSTPEHTVVRLRASELLEHRLEVQPMDTIALSEGASRVFSDRAPVDLELKNCVRLGDICYVSYGMRLNSTDRFKDGEEVPVPADFVFRATGWKAGGKRRTAVFAKFTKEDVLSETHDEVHYRRCIESGRDLDDCGLWQSWWLEYGPRTRVPEFVYRSTIPELYECEKLITGTWTGGYWDRGQSNDFLVCSHSVNLSVRWCDVAGVIRPQLDEVVPRAKRAEYEARSSRFSLGYLLAIYTSEPVQRWLVANRRSMKDHIFPDDLKAVPIPNIPSKPQKWFTAQVERMQALADRLRGLRADGVAISEGGRVDVPHVEWTNRVLRANGSIESTTLYNASKLLFEFQPGHESAPLSGARLQRDGRTIRLGKTDVAWVREGVSDPKIVGAYLVRLFNELNGTFQSVSDTFRIPRDAAGVRKVMEAIDATAHEARELVDERAAIRRAIDAAAWRLYGREPPGESADKA